MTTTQALGWAVVHSLWQCALAPAGLASLLSILPSRAARVRYALATATLVLMVAVPLGTALSLHEASPWHGAPAAVLTPAQTLAGPAVVALRLAARVRTALESALPEIVALWIVGVVAFALRLASGWMAARRLVVMGTHPAPPGCAMALERLAARRRVGPSYIASGGSSDPLRRRRHRRGWLAWWSRHCFWCSEQGLASRA